MKSLRCTTLLVAASLAFNLAAQTNNTREITVRVQDDAGQPIAGVTLESYTCRSEFWGVKGDYRKEKQGSAITSDNGLAKLTVPLEIVDILGRKPGMAFGHGGCGIHENSVALTLHKQDVIAGVVVDEADKPVADAEVSIARISFERLSHSFYNGELLSNYLSARTGSDGSFRIEGCPAGSAMDLTVRKRGKALVSPPRKTLSFAQMTCRAGQQDIKLRMQPGGSVNVKVVVPDKSCDMSQIRVMLGNGLWQFERPILGQPGTNGTFHFEDIAPGTWQVGARFGTNSMPEWVAENAVVSVTNGQVANVTLEAIKGGVVEITTVSSVDSKPLGGARIHCDVVEGFTDKNGMIRIRLAPRNGHSISADGAADMNSWNVVSVKEGETNRVELKVIPPRQFSGTVRYTTGIPATGVDVMADTGESVKTDGAGHYQITSRPLAPALHFNPFLIFRDRNRNLAAFRTVSKDSDVYDLQLSPASTFSGRVEDELGKPLTNAVVTLKLWNGGGEELPMNDGPVKIDAQGHFEIPALPASRRYRLSAKAKGYGSIEKTIQSLDASRAESNTITLRLADKRIAGTVVDEKNNPVPDASISLRGDGQPEISTESDENGRFTFDQVRAGKFTLRTLARSSEGTVPAEAGDTNVVLILGRKLSSPRRPSLIGQPLPDLSWLGFASDVSQPQPKLVCLFFPHAPASDRAMRRLSDQNDALKRKGICVIGICTDFGPPAAFEAWKRSTRPVSFPIACPTAKSEKTKWISDVEKLPWLILTDPQGRITAEGFDLDELDAKLK